MQFLQQREHLGLHGHVEGGGWLIREQHVGLQCQRHGDHDPLPLSARQLVRILAQAGGCLRDADGVQRLDRQATRLVPSDRTMRPDRFRELLADAQDRIERGHRLLEDHRDAIAADRPHPGLSSVVSSVPPSLIEPPARRTAGFGSRPISANAVIDLPEPDSPARHSVSPRAMEKERSETTGRAALPAPTVTVSPRTERIAAPPSPGSAGSDKTGGRGSGRSVRHARRPFQPCFLCPRQENVTRTQPVGSRTTPPSSACRRSPKS